MQNLTDENALGILAIRKVVFSPSLDTGTSEWEMGENKFNHFNFSNK